MKKLYLTGLIVVGVACITIYVENIVAGGTVSFFGNIGLFTFYFPLIVVSCMGMGVCATLYIQEIMKEKELQETSNFDL